jgi:IclR family KDG regulon transcriptional repressor
MSMTSLTEKRTSSTRKKQRKSAPVGVITKVLRILELLNQVSEGLQLKDIANKTGINKSTALRFLDHLERENYLLRDSRGAYFLGLMLMRLGGSRSFEKVLCTISRPILENLRSITSENVNLAVLDGMNVLHLDVLDSPHRLSVVSEIGQTEEIYCTALGKAILAYMEDGPRKDGLFASIKFVAKTPRTITSMARLKEDLAQIRKQGFAHDDEEDSIGARCIGAPIFGPDGGVIAALSVSGPISRIPKQSLLYYAELACQAAREISASINLSSVENSSGAKVNGVSRIARQLSPAGRAPQLAPNSRGPSRGGVRSLM